MSKHLMSAEEVDALGMKLLKLFDMDKLNVTRIGIEVIWLHSPLATVEVEHCPNPITVDDNDDICSILKKYKLVPLEEKGYEAGREEGLKEGNESGYSRGFEEGLDRRREV